MSIQLRRSTISSIGSKREREEEEEGPLVEKVHVAVRVRPMNKKEMAAGGEPCIHMNPSKNFVQVDGEKQEFAVDDALWSINGQAALDGSAPIDQPDVYRLLGAPLLDHALEGFNSTVLAYGQTGSGKTYTMMGATDEDDEVVAGTEGIVPRLCKDLFERIGTARASGTESYSWAVKAVYVEIYCEKVTDLLSKGSEVAIRQTGEHFVLSGARRVDVASTRDVLQVLKRGNNNRRVAATRMNDRSSRSHAVFVLELTETLLLTLPDGTTATAPSKSVTIRLVDLAGSERVGESGVTGANLKEANAINLSLFSLGQVIDCLTDPKRRGNIPPYRNSALTKILKDSFGGNSKTTMIATVGPTDTYKSQSVQTLNYATRARKITNRPVIEEDPQAMELRRKQQELDEVRLQLDEARRKGQRSDELESELQSAQEQFLRHQAEARMRAAEMDRREAELVAMLEAKAQQQKEQEEKLAALAEASKARAAETAARELELAEMQAEAESHAEAHKVALQDMRLRMTTIDAQIVAAEEEAKKREQQLLQKQAAAEADAKKRESELAEKQAAAAADAQKREQELADKQAAAEADAKKRESELAEKQADARKREQELAEKLAAADADAQRREQQLAEKQAAAAADAQKREQELADKQAAAEADALLRERQIAERQAAADSYVRRREAEVGDKQAAAEAEMIQRQRELDEKISKSKSEVEALEVDLKKQYELRLRRVDEENLKRAKAVEIAQRDLDEKVRAASTQEAAFIKQEKELAARLREVETEMKRRSNELKAKEAEVDKQLNKLQAELDDKDRQLKNKEALRKLQEAELLDRTRRLRAEEDHRMRGKESASALTDDLLEEVERWKKQFFTVVKEKKIPCHRCTTLNELDKVSCEMCDSSLLT